MSEIAAVCSAWLSASRASEPTWLATITELEGTSCRRPGARLIFTRDALLAGSTTGGCLERELGRMGPWLTRDGPTMRVFDSLWDDDERQPGASSDGRIHMLLEPLTQVADGGLAVIGRELAAERRVAVATVVRTDLEGVPLGARVTKTSHRLVSQVTDPALSRELAELATAALNSESFSTARVRQDKTTALIEVLEPSPLLFVIDAGRAMATGRTSCLRHRSGTTHRCPVTLREVS